MSEQMKKHPIQLASMQVRKLFAQAMSNLEGYELPEELPFSIEAGHTEYDSSDKTISVKVGVSIKNDDLPFIIEAEVIGTFILVGQFPLDKIEHWASRNAPLILLPYVREHIFCLSQRIGVKGMLLPLFEIPTIKIVNTPSQEAN